ncbi:hypothetical protein EYV94_27620 [Puteibacter caeruleilacunae]|nr:hypothetical protein EYV94_27620 [Puteibacter caeruleilacunae]
MKQKINGGALQLVIAIALVLLLIIGTFLLRKGLTDHFLASAQTVSQLQRNISSSVTMLESRAATSQQDSIDVSLFPLLGDSTRINMKEWGLFDVAQIRTTIRNHSIGKAFLMGSDIGDRSVIPSLYMADPSRYLSIGGFAYIGNNSYLPGFGIRKGYVNGVGYYRDQLTFGKSYKAEKELPPLAGKHLSRLEMFISQGWNDPMVPYDKDLETGPVRRSFLEPTLLIEVSDEAELQGVHLVGNIIVCSSGNIRIGGQTKIDQCLVVAESISIDPGFEGRGQFFASKSIKLGKGSKLKMPSVLAVHNTTEHAEITIEEGAELIGNIISNSFDSKPTSQLGILDRTRIVGQVYCNGYCDFHGTLLGSLYTKGFITIKPGSFYQNYLVNVCIDSDRLPEEFMGVSLTKSNAKYRKLDELF